MSRLFSLLTTNLSLWFWNWFPTVIRAIKWIPRNITIRYWAWIHSFLALGIGWGHAIALQPPQSFGGVVDLSVVFRMGVLTAIGSVIAVVGLIMTRAKTHNMQHKGLWVELVGTVGMAGGPLQYFAIQLGYIVSGFYSDRYALAWFAYAMLSFMVVRFCILIPALIDAGKLAKAQSRSA